MTSDRVVTALRLAAAAGAAGAEVTRTIEECHHEPWRWTARGYCDDAWAYDVAREAAHDARAALRLLGMEDV